MTNQLFDTKYYRSLILSLKEDPIWISRHRHILKPSLLKRFWRGYELMKKEYSSRLLNSKNPILIYQMGSVASTTIYQSLMSLTDEPIFHIHWINEERLIHRNVRETYYGVRPIENAKSFGKTRFLSKYINEHPEKHWKIITLVRDPVSHFFARFFYWLLEIHPEWVEAVVSFNDEQSLGKILNYFRERIDLYIDTNNYWFDEEIGTVFKIDLLEQPFPYEKGYEIYQHENADVLLIRLEDLNRVYNVAFKEFLNINVPSLSNSNTTEGKGYKEVYDLIKKKVYIEDLDIEKLFNLHWVKHFYSAKEIENLKMKWIANINR